MFVFLLHFSSLKMFPLCKGRSVMCNIPSHVFLLVKYHLHQYSTTLLPNYCYHVCSKIWEVTPLNPPLTKMGSYPTKSPSHLDAIVSAFFERFGNYDPNTLLSEQFYVLVGFMSTLLACEILKYTAQLFHNLY